VEMLGRVFVLRVVAACDVTALEAFAQVDPGIAHRQTFFAAFGARRDLMDVAKVIALVLR
jgi:hypothetical protein